MTLAEFCDTVSLSLHCSLVDTQNAKKAYESDSLKVFADIRISQFQDALRYVRNVRRLENVLVKNERDIALRRLELIKRDLSKLKIDSLSADVSSAAADLLGWFDTPILLEEDFKKGA